ncbi:MAG: glutamine amidotransferase [Rhizobiaceae bacterium]
MARTATAIRHIHFEDLGVFDAVLRKAGYDIQYHDIAAHGIGEFDPLKPDLVVVLGGPIGVYETDAYPLLVDERALLKSRLAAERPTLGICLGAQLMADALGAKVEPTGVKEIGFSALTLTPAGTGGPLRHLSGVHVLHWHGDTFAIPNGADHLAETAICRNQAFSMGPNILGLQFHAEADTSRSIEQWLIGHAVELAAAGIDPRTLRDQAAQHGTALQIAARAMFSEWLETVKS